ncbi:MAG: response regulator, partial [Nitrospinota bacterium]
MSLIDDSLFLRYQRRGYCKNEYLINPFPLSADKGSRGKAERVQVGAPCEPLSNLVSAMQETIWYYQNGYALHGPERRAVMAKILVIDDDPEICSLLQDFLSILHHEVRTATRGGEGLALLEEWQPDLLLLDIQMPGMDGIEVLRRAQEIRRDIGAIFITGILDRDTLARAMA